MSTLTRHNVLNLPFGLLAHWARYQGEINTLPGSTSLHSGEARAPVYLLILGEAFRGGAPSAVTQKLYRTSRSSVTLVPCRAIGLNQKRQIRIVHDEPD